MGRDPRARAGAVPALGQERPRRAVGVEHTTSRSSDGGRRLAALRRNCALASATVSSKKLKPLGDRVVVKPSAREDGTREKMDVKKGDRVLYSKYAGTDFKVDGEELLIVSQKDILAIVEV